MHETNQKERRNQSKDFPYVYSTINYKDRTFINARFTMNPMLGSIYSNNTTGTGDTLELSISDRFFDSNVY